MRGCLATWHFRVTQFSKSVRLKALSAVCVGRSPKKCFLHTYYIMMCFSLVWMRMYMKILYFFSWNRLIVVWISNICLWFAHVNALCVVWMWNNLWRFVYVTSVCRIDSNHISSLQWVCMVTFVPRETSSIQNMKRGLVSLTIFCPQFKFDGNFALL